MSVEGGVVPNFSHRVVQDDIPHGLCVLKDIAVMIGLATPWINYMIEWHQVKYPNTFALSLLFDIMIRV